MCETKLQKGELKIEIRPYPTNWRADLEIPKVLLIAPPLILINSHSVMSPVS